MKRIQQILLTIIVAISAVGCSYEEVWTFNRGNFYVWDDSVGLLYGGASGVGPFGNLCFVLVQEYDIEVPGHNMEDYSMWIKANQKLIEKMEQQWKKSSYYTTEKATTIEFTKLEAVSITSDQTLWGREKGSELADMFLMKPRGPYFTFPDGDIVEDEKLNRWMTFEEWANMSCACSNIDITPKENVTPEFEFIPLFIKAQSRNSWNDASITRVSVMGFRMNEDKKFIECPSPYYGVDENYPTFEDWYNVGTEYLYGNR